MANNKVQLANGTVLIDITDTTANASDVLSGEYFYNASGVKTEGSLTIPSTYTVTKTLTNVTTNNNDTEVLVGGSFYMDLTPSSGMIINSITVTMGEIDVTEQVFKAGVGERTIIQNGIYNAEDDWLEGYSSVSANVQNSYTSSDEGKVVNNGSLVSQTSATYTTNNTYDTTLINSVTVNVNGSITPTGTKQISISSNGMITEDVTNYASAEISVAVPNSYFASDEGKVVNNGTLVAQTSDTVTQNGTIDTTLINSLTVNVSGGSTPTEYIIDLSGIGWEVGAVGGNTNRTYEQNKSTNAARLRSVRLIMTAGVQYTYSQNWDNGEWMAQYQLYGNDGKSKSGFTIMSQDAVLPVSPYVAIVIRHSDGTTAMNTSDIATIQPKLKISL